MKRLLIAALTGLLGACAATPQSAGKMIASVIAEDGASIALFDGAGPCEAPALRVQWLTKAREVRFLGCWQLVPHEDHMDVHILWDDGDTGHIQVDAFVKTGV